MLIRRVARPLLSAVFIGQGVDALRNPKPAAEAAQPTIDGLKMLPDSVSTKVPDDAVTVARINAGVQIGGGVLLATGKLPRLASAALAFTVIPGSLGAHQFWSQPDPELKARQRRDFLTDLSLLGGLIIASVDTEGKPSLGWRGRRAARKASDKVSSALPGGSTAGFFDSELGGKVSHGLQVAGERSAELGTTVAEVARERGAELEKRTRKQRKQLAATAKARAAELADAASERSADLADLARQRGAELAVATRDRGAELAVATRDRGAELAVATRDRGAELADVAGKRGAEFADVAGKRGVELSSSVADAAKSRSKDLEKRTRKQRKQLAKAAQQRANELTDAANERSSELVDLARDRGYELAGTARTKAKKTKSRF